MDRYVVIRCEDCKHPLESHVSNRGRVIRCIVSSCYCKRTIPAITRENRWATLYL